MLAAGCSTRNTPEAPSQGLAIHGAGPAGRATRPMSQPPSPIVGNQEPLGGDYH